MLKEKIHLGIVAMPFENGTSGIGVYILKMIHYFSQSDRINLTIFGFSKDRAKLNIPDNVKFVNIPKQFDKVGPNLVWHMTILPVLAEFYKLDVLFLPAGNRRMCLAPPKASYKVAATVHDLAQFHLKNKYDAFRTYYVKNILPFSWRNTPLIISVSESTQNDLQSFTNVRAEKIRKIWNGVEHSAFKPMDKSEALASLSPELDIPESYILYVARIEHPGKNHVGLAEAYAELRRRRPDLKQKLVFCGSDWQGADKVHQKVNQLGIAEFVRFTGFIHESELLYMYSGADLYAFPSLFEGFGIPAVEAMASGIPVVAAERSSLPEILGNTGVLFDPFNTKSIADALEKGLFDTEFREKAISSGLLRAELFSWKTSAEQTLDALIELSEQ